MNLNFSPKITFITMKRKAEGRSMKAEERNLMIEGLND
jgi:hypothetical protein